MPQQVGPRRDDRVLLFTRMVAAALVPVLALAFIILFFEAQDTGEHFAWTIRPPMTAVVMGSGYLGGAYYFMRMATGTRWHHTGVALPAVALFAAVMLLVTVLHWNRFGDRELAFGLWVALYSATPPLIVGVWLLNRERDPGPLTGGPMTPRAGQAALLVVAVVCLCVALVLFARPVASGDWWPWTLSPLTGRILSGWFVLGGTASVLLARDRRAETWRVPLEATFVWAGFLFLGGLRHRSSFEGDFERTLFLGANVIWMVGFGGLYAVVRGRGRRPTSSSPAPNR